MYSTLSSQLITANCRLPYCKLSSLWKKYDFLLKMKKNQTSWGLMNKNAVFHVGLQTSTLRIGAVRLQIAICWQVVLASSTYIVNHHYANTIPLAWNILILVNNNWHLHYQFNSGIVVTKHLCKGFGEKSYSECVLTFHWEVLNKHYHKFLLKSHNKHSNPNWSVKHLTWSKTCICFLGAAKCTTYFRYFSR